VTSRKELLAQALRKYPTWGDAYIAASDELESARRLLLDVEGSLLAYWTDLPESVVQELTVAIRNELGDYEPRKRAGVSE
jgi:hypothetical protein